MNRICTSLAENGYSVTLVGRELPDSPLLRKEKYDQKRIHCRFRKGKWFYLEFNLRLFFYLLAQKANGICAIDLDTILPCLFVSRLKRIPRIYDAHELFTELKEVVSRPGVRNAWLRIEKYAVPRFKLGYTVSQGIADEFEMRYKVRYKLIRNMSRLRPLETSNPSERFLLYQGAVNEARAFEFLVPAMKWVDCRLIVCGDGNFMPQLKALISEYHLETKIELMGMLPPDELWKVSQQAYIGLALAENEGLNQFLALPNKYFDYLHAGLPQITMGYPEYRILNETYEVAILVNDLEPKRIAEAINNLLSDDVVYKQLKENCLKARQVLNWQNEEKKLISFYNSVFNN
jgi:glycosyltransferase involved in cell wall biosynthesis